LSGARPPDNSWYASIDVIWFPNQSNWLDDIAWKGRKSLEKMLE
jgi:hypothetical protein